MFLVYAQTAAERLAAAQQGLDLPLSERLIGVLGVAVMVGLAWLLSHDRKRVNWRLVGSALTLQLIFSLIVLKTAVGRSVFAYVGGLIEKLIGFQSEGARFVFGNLVQSSVPVTGDGISAGVVAQTGAFFAFSVLPTIVFFSALMSVMYYLSLIHI
jgi:CNT family concentrative nucleoside transporter